MIQNYLRVLSKYATFSGRARRQEYWQFVLLHLVIILFLLLSLTAPGTLDLVVSMIIVYMLVMFIPTLAVTVRRLHDTNRSGWWCLINAVPYIGAIALLVLCCLPGTVGPNKYGQDPKQDDGVAPSPVAPAPVEPPPTV